MDRPDHILSCENLVRRFGGFTAVDDVTLGVRKGTIHAVIGPNGAGKTTFFNLLTRFLPASEGRIRFDGHDITHLAADRVAGLGMVRSFQISAIFPTLTLLENVRVALQRQDGQSWDFWRSGKRLRRLNARALELLRRAADAGLPRAEYNMGKIYRDGQGVAADPVAAADWFARAARHGHAGAQDHYARRLAEGDGVAADPVTALGFALLAARQEYPDALAMAEDLKQKLGIMDVAAAVRFADSFVPVRPSAAVTQ